MSPTAGVLVILNPFTTGVVRVLPATLCAALFEITWPLRPRTASVVVPIRRIVPPDGVSSALAPMLIPSVSASVCNTVYSNSNDVVPEPLTYSAFRKLDPIPSRTRGLFAPVPVTVTATSNSTVTTTTSLNSNVLSATASLIDTPVTTGRSPATLCAPAFAIA